MGKEVRVFSYFLILFLLLLSIPMVSSAQTNMTLEYDGNGNLISGDGKYREYNEFNQLIRIYNGSTNDSDQILEEYVYHPTEDRILVKYVREPDENDKYYIEGAVVYFNDNLNREYTNVRGTPFVNDTYYVYDEIEMVGEITKNVSYLGNDYLILRKLYYHGDHLGSVSLITNESGLLEEDSFYGPYGDVLEGGDLSRYSYEGKEFSTNTEDFDYHFRKYDPELMIFTQPDSMIQNFYDPQTLNRYSFERNNPYSYVDSDGKTFADPSDIFAINNFKYAPRYGRPEVFSDFGQDLTETWESNEFAIYRGLWAMTGKPGYDVIKGGIELMAYGSGEDHPFASQDLFESTKDVVFGFGSILLSVGGIAFGGAVESVSFLNSVYSFSSEYGLEVPSFDSISNMGSSIEYDQSSSVSSGSGGSLGFSSAFTSPSKSTFGESKTFFNNVKSTVSNVFSKAKDFFGRLFGR